MNAKGIKMYKNEKIVDIYSKHAILTGKMHYVMGKRFRGSAWKRIAAAGGK